MLTLISTGPAPERFLDDTPVETAARGSSTVLGADLHLVSVGPVA
jgi:hypothetical protein